MSISLSTAVNAHYDQSCVDATISIKSVKIQPSFPYCITADALSCHTRVYSSERQLITYRWDTQDQELDQRAPRGTVLHSVPTPPPCHPEAAVLFHGQSSSACKRREEKLWAQKLHSAHIKTDSSLYEWVSVTWRWVSDTAEIKVKKLNTGTQLSSLQWSILSIFFPLLFLPIFLFYGFSAMVH